MSALKKNIVKEDISTEKVNTRNWIAVLAAILGVFMAILDVQITNASLKDILGTISATQEEGAWITTSYLTAEIVVIPMAPLLCRLFGLRRFMMANSLLFLIFSTLCGLAWNLPSMIIFRMFQGFTGGAFIPTAMMLVLTRLPQNKRALGLAIFMLSTTLAPAFGPVIGGYLTDLYSWPAIFYMNWFPGIFLILGLAWGLDSEPSNMKLFNEINWFTLFAMVVGLGSLVIGLEEGNTNDWFESSFIRNLFILSAISLTLWIGLSLRSQNNFVNLRLFARRNFLISSIVVGITGAGLYGSTYLLPLFLSQIAGYNSGQVGAVIMWMGLPQIIIMPLAANLSKKFDNRIVCSVGLFLFSISCFINSTMTSSTTGLELITSQIFRGLGQPLIILALSNFATARMELENMGSASSLFNMSRNLGGAIGTSMLATGLTIREQLHSLRIGESINLFSPATLERIQLLSSKLIQPIQNNQLGFSQEALLTIDAITRRESYVMAYNDCFFILGAMLVISIFLMWLAKPVS